MDSNHRPLSCQSDTLTIRPFADVVESSFQAFVLFFRCILHLNGYLIAFNCAITFFVSGIVSRCIARREKPVYTFSLERELNRQPLD